MSPTRIRYRLAGVAVATLAVAAVTPVIPVSAAPSATVSPGTVAPGGRVSLNVEGCGTKTGRATSRAFGNVTLTPGNLEATNLYGAATVYRDAPTGSHPVTFECGGTGGRRITVTLQVAPGAARGGLGGSVESMSTGQVALGGTLAASALCAGIWILRRRTARTG
ncbi:hypothetical protein Slala03_10470 [Streptomyces lavendulae subsp. lavendulae]|uniref:hypothetical protein n=1 Tax=Streptomyces lavendulae TaxID=1914 RepID=UPI0024A09EA2|nr:hypothetical protein [Streptomyces lavendulae]GLV81358.1 hypothetical protein Slala03_10470 [Streptomyces lavendulae subsp. lavendulae]GLX37451.1 hypothetical protein Sros01_35240 [Streptomyces roseochromogenus]